MLKMKVWLNLTLIVSVVCSIASAQEYELTGESGDQAITLKFTTDDNGNTAFFLCADDINDQLGAMAVFFERAGITAHYRDSSCRFEHSLDDNAVAGQSHHWVESDELVWVVSGANESAALENYFSELVDHESFRLVFSMTGEEKIAVRFSGYSPLDYDKVNRFFFGNEHFGFSDGNEIRLRGTPTGDVPTMIRR